ncbi:hypothetical protein [Methanosphaera sp.]
MNFMEKYSVWITTIIGLIITLYLIIKWNTCQPLQKLMGIYFIALAVHEWEELKYPGGFVELVMGMTGLKIKNMEFAKTGLLYSLYMQL